MKKLFCLLMYLVVEGGFVGGLVYVLTNLDRFCTTMIK